MDEVLDGSEAGDAPASRRPRRQSMAGQRRGDLVEPLAMLQQGASDVANRTVPPVVRRAQNESGPIIAWIVRRPRRCRCCRWYRDGAFELGRRPIRPTNVAMLGRFMFGVRYRRLTARDGTAG
jgi:hypothetical protein